jgi:hypothetical protein
MSLCLGVVCACDRRAKAAPPHAIQSIENDYARALAEAQKRKLPLFVEVWARFVVSMNASHQPPYPKTS